MKDRLDATAVAGLLLCCALWGLNQVAIKAALPEVPPLVQLSLRSVFATVLLLAWMRFRGVRFSLSDGTLWPGLLAGTLFALEFACIFVGLNHTTAARSTVFVNTSPLVVAAVLGAFVPAERLRPLQIVGLLIAFAAVALAFAEGFSAHGGTLLGDGLAILAAVLWGLTTVTIRMTVLAREKEIAIMRLVGATDSFIRRPFLLDGLFKGLVGGLLALLLTWSAAFALEHYLRFQAEFFDQRMMGLGLLVGALMGLFGSSVSVGRHLKKL